MASVTLRLGPEQLKPFVSAITCVSKAGKEISLECDAETITLRALNDAHSASAEITFDSGFLDGYAPPSLAGDGRPTALVKCTTMASTWQSVFRSLKNVLSMEIMLEVEDDDAGHGHDAVDASVIVFRLCCDKRITKTHRIKTTDTQTLRPIFDKASSPNRIKMRPFHLTTLLQHIHGTDEVSMSCGKDQVRFESYYTNPLDVKKHVHTETTVDTSEFIAYVFESGADALNEAALLAYCDACGLAELVFYFSDGGSPILLSTESVATASYGAQIVLSTVATLHAGPTQDACPSQEAEYEHNASSTAKKQKRSSS
ncbi:hypothetical protein SPRG_02075 [Saprolegnia parasitica CBS 223.65]|uniref:Uncharacterized protein n=1 Tax=Saprolegnia parasitica (strain CBS 223.65) TaxID=695850 RepID=A0A067D3H2_SAPPC|nr:hypothetical protein SPRG_02075 [Saprolegnia parasitica CBS 223.65]KDO33266.1 hypothetical protein SPRG_02075 [Saprolegnia parasitica CBS 223.65]|eukprot:XP_012196022.1 hypothetical protein SPRG_02075 [Saprolegnia parasitica CBS 223.65]